MRRLGIAAVAALCVAGCGGDDAATVDKTAPFVGTWTVASGTLMGMCPNAPMGFPAQISQMLERAEQVIAKGTASDLTIGVLTGCNVTADVTDKVATIRANQMCSFMFMGFPVNGTIQSGNYTLTDTGASFAYTGTAAIGTIMCNVSASGTSTRGSAGDAGAPPSGG